VFRSRCLSGMMPVMQTSRMTEQLSIVASAESSCSVLWLLPDEGDDLAQPMTAVLEASPLAARGFLGVWDQSKAWQARTREVEAVTVLDAEMRVGTVRMTAAMLDLRPDSSAWFWREFGGRVRQRQLCAALVPAEATSAAGWAQAGLQLVLAAAAVQVGWSATHQQVQRTLAEAFIAETLAVGGIAVTRVCPELLHPGIAVTARAGVGDSITTGLRDAVPADPLLVERSRYLSEPW
jgi:hypothetical protein